MALACHAVSDSVRQCPTASDISVIVSDRHVSDIPPTYFRQRPTASPLDNGGFPFEWVSNLQVISAVHLKPLKTKNRTYQLPAANKKTVKTTMKSM